MPFFGPRCIPWFKKITVSLKVGIRKKVEKYYLRVNVNLYNALSHTAVNVGNTII